MFIKSGKTKVIHTKSKIIKLSTIYKHFILVKVEKKRSYGID